MANGKKTGGRQKGTPNKATAARFVEIVGSGLTPLEYMLAVVRDTSVEYRRRDAMAQASAPYIHPRLASTEVKGDPDKPIEHKLKIEFIRPGE